MFKGPRTKVLEVLALLLCLGAAGEILYLRQEVNQLRRSLYRIDPPSIGIGERLFPLVGTGITNEPTQFDPGSVTLVFFLSPECGACQKSMPAVESTAEFIGTNNVSVITPRAASVGAGRDLRTYLSGFGLGSIKVAQIEGAECRRHHLTVLPTTMIVDKAGNVASVWRGSVEPALVVRAWNRLQEKRG